MYAETVHKRLGTVMTCAHGNAEAVEQSAHVEMMYIPDEEGGNGITCPRTIKVRY